MYNTKFIVIIALEVYGFGVELESWICTCDRDLISKLLAIRKLDT